MCGIVGYVGSQSVGPLLIEGMGRLEYRGYDSAGIAVSDTQGRIAVRKCTGKLANLIACLVPGPWGQLPHCPGGGPQTEGDQLHSCRGLPGPGR